MDVYTLISYAIAKERRMSSWLAFEREAPELAELGRRRLEGRVAYLGTLRADGGPRVHPVVPIIGEELFLFMEPTSPKGKDLARDGRYALHCGVEDSNGGEGEFAVRGRARLTEDAALREQAVRACPYTPREDYILFVLSVEYAFWNHYDAEGRAQPRRWRSIAKD